MDILFIFLITNTVGLLLIGEQRVNIGSIATNNPAQAKSLRLQQEMQRVNIYRSRSTFKCHCSIATNPAQAKSQIATRDALTSIRFSTTASWVYCIQHRRKTDPVLLVQARSISVVPGPISQKPTVSRGLYSYKTISKTARNFRTVASCCKLFIFKELGHSGG